MDVSLWAWAGVVAAILAALALDLFVLHRDAHVVSMREAAITSVVWVSVGVAFGIGVWLVAGGENAGEYFAGYVIEKALAVDNIFVFALILTTFSVPLESQHRVLFLGVVGALVLRAGFILAGASLLDAFHWVIYLFGGFLVLTGIRMATHRGEPKNPAEGRLVGLVRRVMPVTEGYEGQRLLVRRAGRLMATPLLVVLIVIEATDVVFAVDSIPAIFAVTDEAFLVFTSNAFAILGLRALYFLLAGALHRFTYLTVGLSAVLVFVGLKMLLSEVWHIPIGLSLGVIVAILAVAVGASLLRPAKSEGLPAESSV